MKELYDQSAQLCNQNITKLYSTSFTLGIRTLHRRFRTPIYSIYGFVRLADEIVDTFHNYNKAALLNQLERDTYQAINEGISINPVLHAFQLVVNQYQIKKEYIEAFLASMRNDLEPQSHNSQSYTQYIFGSAEVVGLMCLQVFCEGNTAKFNQLSAPARKLGAAFQKVNFLRDFKADYKDLGRLYFPQISFGQFNNETKRQIEKDIEQDFADAHWGIMNLPLGARLGVLLAYKYYMRLFDRIKKTSACRIQNQRVRVPDLEKMFLLSTTYLRHSLA
jgi:15-cis-phytoene synthase